MSTVPPFRPHWLGTAVLSAGLALAAQASAAEPVTVATCAAVPLPAAYQPIQEVYLAFYLRPGDPGGLRYWSGEAGGDISRILAQFGQSEEAERLYGKITAATVGDAIDRIYQALFGVLPDKPGRDYYIGEFTAGRASAADLAYRILKGAQNDDKRAIESKLAAANFFSRTVDADLDGNGQQVTYDRQDEATVRGWMREIVAGKVPTPEQASRFIREKVAAASDPLNSHALAPRLSGFSPSAVQVGQSVDFTVQGQALPSVASLNISGVQCDDPAKVQCDGSGFVQRCAIVGDAGDRVVRLHTNMHSGATIDSPKPLKVTSQGTQPQPPSTSGKLPHSGTTGQQCYKKDSDDLVPCNSPEAVALSGAEKQDGMRGHINPMSYSFVPKSGGGHYDKTECVKDNVTGLIWEGKVNNSADRRHYQNLYSHEVSAVFPDVGSYLRHVNGIQLCGFNDWRLPTVYELQSLVDYSKPGRSLPAINTDWFPYTRIATHKFPFPPNDLDNAPFLQHEAVYMTSSKSLKNHPLSGTSAVFWNVAFGKGGAIDILGQSGKAVRLVRGPTAPTLARCPSSAPGRFVINGDEVTDTQTGLVWARCGVGQNWDGNTCVGDAHDLSHQEAMEHAKGRQGWRLPNVKELSSILDMACSDPRLNPFVEDWRPAIDATVFPNASSKTKSGGFVIHGGTYWTATPYAGDPLWETSVWVVDFDTPAVYPTVGRMPLSAAVRLVRTNP
ncbi:DUF1566 domain-containing protein [Allofranklinella schreckenbergeri]|uniref:DUF1566 domain-containing protein n=1 Tax=Allofranklinella schreckenbergeri TaxID=1076744 RepID=A0A3M6QFA1_9BURK|nr:DUF1566 domain-containing protein [Allofranklinella schreckenbergeri]RMX01778.1 DUF1566 domain-containing protein [Allofranklinella schreckenbergeri]